MAEPIPIQKGRYPRIIQVVTSMNSSCGDEYIYGLDTEGNLWIVGFAGVGTARWEMYIPAGRERKKS